MNCSVSTAGLKFLAPVHKRPVYPVPVHHRPRRLHHPQVAVGGVEQRHLVRKIHFAGVSEDRFLEGPGRRARTDQREGV